MKLSQFLILSMITASVSASAQIAHNNQPKPIKKKNKVPTKTVVDSSSVRKPINKSPNGYYCPPCGKG